MRGSIGCNCKLQNCASAESEEKMVVQRMHRYWRTHTVAFKCVGYISNNWPSLCACRRPIWGRISCAVSSELIELDTS